MDYQRPAVANWWSLLAAGNCFFFFICKEHGILHTRVTFITKSSCVFDSSSTTSGHLLSKTRNISYLLTLWVPAEEDQQIVRNRQINVTLLYSDEYNWQLRYFLYNSIYIQMFIQVIEGHFTINMTSKIICTYSIWARHLSFKRHENYYV